MARHPAGPVPREAVSYLRRKGVRTGFSYEDVWREEHAHAFTVAKMMDLDLLRDVQASLVRAQAEGTTFEQWRKEMAEHLSKRGWWGREEVVDPKTGKTVVAQLGSSRRLATIWRVNLGQASQAGAWERGARSSRPYVMYRVGSSREHREQHLAWDGLVLPRDDPFWAVANPTNGWGCKCYSVSVSEAQYRRYRRDGVAAPAAGDEQPGKMDIKTRLVDNPTETDEAPALRPMTYANRRTGEAHTGYAGIDPGFEHNPGVGREQQLRTQWQDRDRIFAGQMEPAPESTPVRDGIDLDPAGSQAGAAREALRAIGRVHGAGAVSPAVPVRESQDKGFLGRWDPSGTGTIEISVHGADSWPALTVAHEIGHMLDYRGLPVAGDYESRTRVTDEMKAVIRAIRQSPTYKRLGKLKPAKARKYFRSPIELWARAFAQWVAWRSGSSRLKGQLDRILTDEDPATRIRQWPYDEFAPIAAAIDRLMEARGWARRKAPPAP